MRRISSHLLSTPCGLERGRVVTLSDEGTIHEISTPEHLDREDGVEIFSGLLVPGFFNAHCHLELSHLRGRIAPGGGFEAFVAGMKAAPRNYELQITNYESLPSAEAGGTQDAQLSPMNFWDAKMWAEGVSAVADICNGSSTFALKRRSPIRYHNFIEIFGTEADPAKAFALCDRAVAMGLAASVTPHSLYSLNRETFAKIVENPLSIIHYPLSIHFMESEFEVRDPAARLIEQVPADREVMLVHNCMVTQRDIDIVMGHFTAPVTWVLCPGSNRYISGFIPPVELLRRNGLRIAVGTDSLASNESLSMVRELAMLGDVPLAELLSWAAADTIEVGHTPGLVLLTGVDLEKMALTDSTKAQRII
jgi:cytosine/adenosine deaminase-related metal-dependent hydrolase